MHVALVGGPGTGKTETAKKLCDLVEDSEYIYMSRFAVGIPMALQRLSHPCLLDYSRQEYINTVLSNIDAPEVDATRTELNEFGRQIIKKYGPTVMIEAAFAAIPNDKTGIIDNVGTVANVGYLLDKGVYVVGHQCLFETQVRRMLERAKKMDSKKRPGIEEQIRDTEKLFELDRCMSLGHIVYDTDKWNTVELACAIAPVAMTGRRR